MAIAFDASSNSSSTSTVSPLTWNHTCTGTNGILFVGISLGSATDDVSAVTYAGAALTRIAIQAGLLGQCYLYYKVGPATGSNTVSITWSGGGALCGTASSYSGASQTGQPDAFGSTGDTNANTKTVSVTVVASNCWIVETAEWNGIYTLSAGTGMGAFRTQNATGAIVNGIGDSNATVATGSVSITMNSSVADHNAGVAASFSPAAGGAAAVVPVPLLTIMGAG